MNGLLEQRDLYQEEDWADVLLGSETRELLDQGIDKLSEDDLARLNRLLIEVPYEEHFRVQPPKQIVITYFGAGVSPPIRVSERRVKQVIELIALPLLLELLVGPIALLTGILVTASIIPQMFDPGSLSLLLSKPVSRSLMFLAKFAGGCAFILINAAYFFAGMWLIAGPATRDLEPRVPALHPIFPVPVRRLLQRLGVYGCGVAQCDRLRGPDDSVLVRLLGCGCHEGQFSRVSGRHARSSCAWSRPVIRSSPSTSKVGQIAGMRKATNGNRPFWRVSFGDHAARAGTGLRQREQDVAGGSSMAATACFDPVIRCCWASESDGWMQVEGPQLPEQHVRTAARSPRTLAGRDPHRRVPVGRRRGNQEEAESVLHGNSPVAGQAFSTGRT